MHKAQVISLTKVWVPHIFLLKLNLAKEGSCGALHLNLVTIKMGTLVNYY